VATAVPTASQRKTPASRQRRPGGRLLVGSSQLSRGKISAAKKFDKFVPKTVVYVDNLSQLCTVDDLKSFVADGLSVKVISCFKVVPRHRGDELPDENRSAFRLTVNRSDLDKLLDDTAWPECVTISEWVYKDPAVQQDRRDRPEEKRGRFHSPPSPSPVREEGEATRDESTDMDATVVDADTRTTAETSVKLTVIAHTNQDGGSTV